MTLNDFLSDWRSPSATILVHTSGSTGQPKPLRVEKQRMLNSARITCDFLGLKPGDTALLCMPLDYIAGKMVVVRAIERRLCLIAETPSSHPLDAARLREALLYSHALGEPNLSCHTPGEDTSSSPLARNERGGEGAWGREAFLRFAAMVPLQVYNSLQVPDERQRLRNIGDLIIGGGAIDESLQRELKDFPHRVWSTYGMTETLSHIALRRLNGPEASLWYTPFPSVTVSLNANGCLVIDAPLVHDGPLETHDRAELHNGQFRILGRIDNVIDSGGIKIQIEEVERLLKPHLPSPFLITKRTDARLGEAEVLLTEGTDLSAVEQVCRAVLPRYWQPKNYLHIDHLPLTETGKPARKTAENLVIALQ